MKMFLKNKFQGDKRMKKEANVEIEESLYCADRDIRSVLAALLNS